MQNDWVHYGPFVDLIHKIFLLGCLKSSPQVGGCASSPVRRHFIFRGAHEANRTIRARARARISRSLNGRPCGSRSLLNTRLSKEGRRVGRPPPASSAAQRHLWSSYLKNRAPPLLFILCSTGRDDAGEHFLRRSIFSLIKPPHPLLLCSSVSPLKIEALLKCFCAQGIGYCEGNKQTKRANTHARKKKRSAELLFDVKKKHHLVPRRNLHPRK